jgi:hypothetical protein
MRPLYVGTGECDCGRVDARLYRLPGTAFTSRPCCGSCLERRGYKVPEARTADTFDNPADPSEAITPVDKTIDLGHGHTFQSVTGVDSKLVGWLHSHPDARNPSVLCQSFCAVRPLNGCPVHQVMSDDPLTLTPSLKCRVCGAHGDVINGKWEPRQ